MLVVNGESVFQINQGVSVHNIKDVAYFMLDSRTGAQYDLTEIEYLILIRIARHVSLRKIAAELEKTYNAHKQEIEEDLKDYAAQLLDNGLISVL